MSKISKYIIFSLLMPFCISSVSAQEKQDSVKLKHSSWLQDVRVEMDLASLLKTALAGGKTYSYEASVQARVFNKYFPVLEAGFAGAKYSNTKDIEFSTNGLFGRFGLDLSILSQKSENTSRNLLLLGARLGVSNFKYNINNVLIGDDYWGVEEIRNYQKQNATRLWFEVVGSVRVEIFKNIFMGWSAKYKSKFGAVQSGSVVPAYIPGYGAANDVNWDFGYSIGYCF